MSTIRSDLIRVPFSVMRNREFPSAYQGKFFDEHGIGTLTSGAAARRINLPLRFDQGLLAPCADGSAGAADRLRMGVQP
jgi:hypothetical protein